MDDIKLKEKLKEYIKSKNTKTLTLSEIYEILHLPYLPENDKIIYSITKQLEEEKYIQPLKTTKKNHQGSFEKYKILNKNEENVQRIQKEILNLNLKIQIDYYLKHPEEYENNKEFILRINQFIKKTANDSTASEIKYLTVNERSYEIFKYEKMLQENEHILKRLGLSYQDLYANYTYEPFFYYINTDYRQENEEKTILIIENKDTFWTIVRTIQKLKLPKIYMVIYGEGKKIIKSFSFINELNVSFEDDIKYFGDIDFEGINIYETLKEKYSSYKISVYKIGYETILDIENEPEKIRTAQNINSEKITKFMKEFTTEYKNKLERIFQNKKYIPQEVFNLEVASEKMKEGEAYVNN